MSVTGAGSSDCDACVTSDVCVLAAVGIRRPDGKRSDTPPAETNDDKSGKERKGGRKESTKKRERNGGADVVRKLKLTLAAAA